MSHYDYECQVCYHVTTDVLSCGHSLCFLCAERWFSRKATCPKCRQAVEEAKGYEREDESDSSSPLPQYEPVPLPRFTEDFWNLPQVHWWDPTARGEVTYSLATHYGPPRGVRVVTLRPAAPHENFLLEDDVVLFVNQARVIHAGTVSDHLARVIDEDSQMVCAILDRGASHRRRRTH